MYQFSQRLKLTTYILMALGLLGLAYGFLSAPSTVEDAKAIIAAHGEDSHATGHETAAHAEDHDAAHDQHLLDQMRNRPWSAFYVSALFSGRMVSTAI
jgi:hypothetical protein